jgi:hypothetical protein
MKRIKKIIKFFCPKRMDLNRKKDIAEHPLCRYCGNPIKKKVDIMLHDKEDGIEFSHTWCFDEHEEKLMLDEKMDRAENYDVR